MIHLFPFKPLKCAFMFDDMWLDDSEDKTSLDVDALQFDVQYSSASWWTTMILDFHAEKKFGPFLPSCTRLNTFTGGWFAVKLDGRIETLLRLGSLSSSGLSSSLEDDSWLWIKFCASANFCFTSSSSFFSEVISATYASLWIASISEHFSLIEIKSYKINMFCYSSSLLLYSSCCHSTKEKAFIPDTNKTKRKKEGIRLKQVCVQKRMISNCKSCVTSHVVRVAGSGRIVVLRYYGSMFT